MKHYGALRNYSDELDRIERIVENEFESVHPHISTMWRSSSE